METTLKLAAQTYATLNPDYKNEREVLEAIQSGNNTVERAVITLMLSAV